MKNNLKAPLSKARSTCLTVGLQWSNRQKKTSTGITEHLIVDWEMKSVVLLCRRLKGKQTSENIRHELEETLVLFEIVDKICTVAGEYALNMVKAFKFSLLGYKCNSERVKSTMNLRLIMMTMMMMMIMLKKIPSVN